MTLNNTVNISSHIYVSYETNANVLPSSYENFLTIFA